MIVNPQLFNYRLIKSTLVIVLAVFGVLGYLKYQSIEAQNVFTEQENKLIEHELAEVLRQNDRLSNEKSVILENLEQANAVLQNAQDSIAELTSNLSVLQGVKAENYRLKQQLAQADNVLAQTSNQVLALQKELQAKETVIETVSEPTVMASNAVLATSFISVQGFETNSAARYATYKAKRINNLEVCFNLAGNEQITPGNKTVYVQIINPDNNVLADKGVVKNNKYSLVYSFKTNVEYYNQNTKVCVAVEADRDDKPLQKGNYKINIFNDFTLIGSTELHLE
ncbi:hypothetical protein FJ651_03890 [Paucihalobacter ruber]|uniref:Chromosome partitioning protein ParA n=1 Tax=Paucihalobacter ruber TaxID=2567861 RepID=A0A506PLS8_9FLAO|nr:hypothetical protein [Paucihalobacter ruber]TPV34681.1 hypothetical protein FJ651_03890 [Paucihalobacter ruber]